MPRARYREVAEDLRRDITAGTYQPGDWLPTIPDLMTRFGTSRPTIVKAFDELSLDGLIHRVRGHGIQVAPEPPPHIELALADITSPDAWHKACATSGRDGRLQYNDAERPVQPRDAKILGVEAETALPARTVTGLVDGTAVRVDHITRISVRPATTWTETIGARLAGSDEPGLRVRAGSPLLVVERIGRAPGEDPVEVHRITLDPAHVRLKA